MAKTTKPLEEYSFEQAFGELESIVETMEGEQKPLDENLRLFERGQALARHCTTLLDHAELRIKELNADQPAVEAEE